MQYAGLIVCEIISDTVVKCWLLEYTMTFQIKDEINHPRCF